MRKCQLEILDVILDVTVAVPVVAPAIWMTMTMTMTRGISEGLLGCRRPLSACRLSLRVLVRTELGRTA
jgi:hypothetical protein